MAYASLSIDLKAQLASLQGGMDKAVRLAEKDAARMERAFSQVKAVAGGIGGALVAGLSVTAVTSFIQNTNEALLAIKDLSEGTGSSIEQISALENALKLANRELADVQPVLVKFNGALKEADGKNGVSQALKAIGLDAEELRRLDPVDALQKVAKALQGYADDGDKARLVQELFGKSVAEVLPLLNDLADAQLEATKGIRESVEEADKFEKNLASIKKEVSDLAREIAGPLTASINDLLVSLRGVREGGFFKSLGDELAINFKGEQLRTVVQEIESIQETINRQGGDAYLTKRLALLRTEAAALTRDITGLSASLKGFANAADPASAPSDYSNEGRNSTKPKVKRPGKPGEKLPGLSAITDPANQQLQDFLRSEKAVYDQIVRDAAAARDSVQRLLEDTDTAKIAKLQVELQSLLDFKSINGETPALTEKIIELRLQIDELNAKRIAPQVDIKSDFLRSEKGQYEQTDEFMRNLKEETKSLDDVFKDLGLTFNSALEDAIVKGENLRDVLQGLGQDILRILSREFVTEPLTKAFIKILRGDKGGSGGGSLGELVGSLLGGLPSFAVGTDYVPRDMVAKIHAGERIVPAAENRRSRGGVVNNINIQTLPGTRAETTETENSSGGIDTLVRMVDERMAAGVTSGGSKTARALQGTYGLSRATGAPRRG